MGLGSLDLPLAIPANCPNHSSKTSPPAAEPLVRLRRRNLSPIADQTTRPDVSQGACVPHLRRTSLPRPAQSNPYQRLEHPPPAGPAATKGASRARDSLRPTQL
jgi:hypothetical protein